MCVSVTPDLMALVVSNDTCSLCFVNHKMNTDYTENILELDMWSHL